jgi:hypothetical protein
MISQKIYRKKYIEKGFTNCLDNRKYEQRLCRFEDKSKAENRVLEEFGTSNKWEVIIFQVYACKSVLKTPVCDTSYAKQTRI